jgi:molybdopterin converting factor small subunit
VSAPGAVTVEFFGIPRQRAGRAELRVSAASVTEALAAVQAVCPRLVDLRAADGRIAANYLVSINGNGFVTDPSAAMHPGDHLLVLSADAGG